MRNRPVRLLALFASATLALGAAVSATGPSASAAARVSAAPRLPKTIVVPVAGSAKYLAYTKTTRPAGPGFRTGGLFVLKKGSSKPRRVASISNETDGPYFLAGSMLVYNSYEQTLTGPGNVIEHFTSWFNLDTGTSGRVESDATSTVAAAPDGWITLDTSSGSLADQPTDGPARSLGQPLPQSTRPLVTGGTKELVVYSVFSDASDGNGELRVMAFDKPGEFRTLIPRLKDATEEDYYCPSVTSHYVACETEGARVRLIPLDGSSEVRTTKGCPRVAPVVMHHSAAWPGCGGRFTVLSPSGKVHVSTHHFGQMVPAYGELAVAGLSRQKIELVSSATSKPKVLVQLS